MKKTASLLLVLVGFACQHKSSETTNTDTTMIHSTEIVGNDADEHGCKASAGYTWSVLKNECIRVFEVGTRLNSPDSTQTTAAFVIFSADASKAELYVPDELKSLVISQKNSTTWANDEYTLSKSGEIYSLEKGQELLYKTDL